MQRLLKEAQSRKLDRVAAAYAVGGWLLVQAAGIALPAFGAPGWVLRAFIASVLVGFPLTLWLAWVMAPQPRAKARAAPVVTTRTDTVLLTLLAGVITLSAAQFAYDVWRGPARISTEHLGVRSEASIAVLPFVNMSGDPAKEYFSDGIADELISKLSRERNLRVAARTSSFALRGRNLDIKAIAALLRVGAVLDGSVREDGTRVRITAELVSGTTGFPIWSQSYDRELTSILSLQDEVARAITLALTHTLAGPPEAATPRIDPEVYRKYLEGQFNFEKRTDEGRARALDLFREVAKAAPDFADDFAALAYALHLSTARDPNNIQLRAEFRTALDRALALDPRNPQALYVHMLDALDRQDWSASIADMKTLKESYPNSALTQRGLAFHYGALGFEAEGLAAAREAMALDPLSFVGRLNLADALMNVGRWDEAAAAAKSALALQPNHPIALDRLCEIHVLSGQLGDARKIEALLAAPGMPKDPNRACSFLIAWKSGDAARAEAMVKKRDPSNPDDALNFGVGNAIVGDLDAAMDGFEHAFESSGYAIFTLPAWPVLPKTLFETPRWKALTRRPQFRAWQAAHDRLAAELVKGD